MNYLFIQDSVVNNTPILLIFLYIDYHGNLWIN
jgi:hypothetical protein